MTRLLLLMSIATLLFSCTPSSRAVRYSPMELANFTVEHQEFIKENKVALGMDQQAIRFSWGAPSSVQIKETPGGNMKEEWEYKTFGSNVTTLQFTESILTGIVSGHARNPFAFSRKDRSKGIEQNKEQKTIQQQ
jgi:hypothetical protein